MATRIWPGLPENLKNLVEHIWNTHKNDGLGYQLENPKLKSCFTGKTFCLDVEVDSIHCVHVQLLSIKYFNFVTFEF